MVALLALVVIQFFKPERNTAAGPSPNALATKYPVPANVAAILKRSCNDCHSNTTTYPAYASIQPVAWWLDNHIQEGKAELNFDEFAAYPAGKAAHKLEEVAEMVEENEMPLPSYLLVHRQAALSEQDARVLIEWAKGLRGQIIAANPDAARPRRPQPAPEP